MDKGKRMRDIRISDETMKRAAASKELSLTFKEKLELAKLLDSLGVSVIEVEGISKPKADALRIKSIASLVKNCTVAVPVNIDGDDVDAVWAALREAKHPRLQVQVATSPAVMEYVYRKKAEAMVEAVRATVAKCAALASEVEFIADDATRTDAAYLAQVITAAIEAGATTVTVCDDAGAMLPDEVAAFVRGLRTDIPQLENVSLGISCSNNLYMSVSSAASAVSEGADEVKATSYPLGVLALPKIVKVLADKGDAYDVRCGVQTAAIKRTIAQIERICKQGLAKNALLNAGMETDDDMALTIHDDAEAVATCVAKLGYDLSDDDAALVYEAFVRIASKKDVVGARELDSIVASTALQVPATYTLKRYVVNSGNVLRATATILVEKNGEPIERVAMGDGPIDAAFAALEQIIGKRYELDDWQMQSVTEGQEAMGEAIVKIMNDGKVYSGRGISTDIIGSSIRAYLNAVNKIVYEEEN